MAEGGFQLREVVDTARFMDVVKPAVRGEIRLVFVPTIPENLPRSLDGFGVMPLEPLLRMQLASFSLNDRVDLHDMLEVGLITPEIEPHG